MAGTRRIALPIMSAVLVGVVAALVAAYTASRTSSHHASSPATASYGSVLTDQSVRPPTDLVFQGGQLSPTAGDLAVSDVVARLTKNVIGSNGTVADVDLLQTKVVDFSWHSAPYDQPSYVIVVKGRTEMAHGGYDASCSVDAPAPTCKALPPITVNRIYIVDPSTAFVYAAVPSGG